MIIETGILPAFGAHMITTLVLVTLHHNGVAHVEHAG